MLAALCGRKWARGAGWPSATSLPYRRRWPTGPPSGSSAGDLSGIAEALAAARALGTGPVIAGGHFLRGRLTSMVVAGRPGIADRLTLFSYPLHPPGKPERLRIEHFGSITVPSVFTHGGSDPFGSLDELRAAVALIPAPSQQSSRSAGARHDLGTKVLDVPALAVEAALVLSSPH